MVNAIQRLINAGIVRMRLRSKAAMSRAVRLTGAAVAAFAVAQVLFPDTVPILAPLTALLVVEVTLKDIVTSGVQRIASVTAGVLLAVGFSAVVGLSWWSLGALIAISILIGQLLRLGPHMLEVPISAMLVLAVGGAEAAATDRISETLLGAAVGIAVNVLLPPAVRANNAADAVQRFASELARLLTTVAGEMREPITEQQAVRWMNDARALTRHVAHIDKALDLAENSRQLNPRALIVPDTNNTLRADLEALEHTNVAVRSMFRSILDGLRDHPTPDPARGEDLRLLFAALLEDLASAIQAFGDLAQDEGTDHVDANQAALSAALQTVREARDRIDDLHMMDSGSDSGWELSDPVLETVGRVLRDLDLAERSRRQKPVKPTVNRVDPLEMLKAAHQLWHSAPRTRQQNIRGARGSADRRETAGDLTGPHRLPLARTSRTRREDPALETGRMRALDTGRMRAVSRPAGRPSIRPGRRY